MIKKIYAILISIFIFTGINTVFGGFDETIKINIPGSFYAGSGFSNYISSALQFNNNGNKYIYIDDNGRKHNKLYVFRNNNILYFYGYYERYNDYSQGFFNKFCKITGTGVCTSNYTEATRNEFYSLTGVDFSQFIGSRQAETDDPGLCFYNKNNNTNYCTSPLISTDGVEGNLTGNLNIPDGTTVFDSYTQNSPFFSTSSTPDFSLDNVYCPTVRQLINNYNKNGFSSGLCYSSDKIYNGSSFVSVEPQSIFDLFSSKEDFISSINKFATYCETSVYTPDVCISAFSGEDLRFNLISKIPNNSSLGGKKSLYNYCDLYNYDPNTTTCVGSGINPDFGSDFNYDDVVHLIGEGNYTVVSPFVSGSVFDNGSGYTYSGDVISNIQHLYKKFTSLFSKQTSNLNGLLPSWILIPFILLVLFKLFKK